MAVKTKSAPAATKLPAIRTIAESLIFQYVKKKAIGALRRPEVQGLARTILTHTATRTKPVLNAPQLRLRKVMDDAIFRMATKLALDSLDPNSRSAIYAIPIGIYLDTSDAEVIAKAKNFWKHALAEEHLEVIFEYEAHGSWFKGIIAVIRKPKDRKALLSRLEKKGIEFTKKFGQVTRVIALSTFFMGPAPPPPTAAPTPPTPVIQPATPQEAKGAWGGTFRKIEEKTKSAGEVAGGLLAAYDLLKKKDKKKGKKDEDDE